MPQVFVRHHFRGGWSTDFGPQIDIAPTVTLTGGAGDDLVAAMELPFLETAENCIFELDGGPHKAPGTARLNSSALASGADVMGVFDAWFSGTLGTPTQRRIVHVGTVIMRDDGAGSFTNLFTGLEAGKVPSYAMLEDLLVMCSDSTIDVPRSWDGTTAQNLAGGPPRVGFVTVHQGHMFGAGDWAQPSRLYYVTAANLGVAGWSNIDIDPDDGDRITGIISWHNELWVFKGPYRGSIHRITGTSSANFARQTFIKGVGAVAHNAIFEFGPDVGFLWSDGSIRSLIATDKYGDADPAVLSGQISTWIKDHVTFSALSTASVGRSDLGGYALIALPIDAAMLPNTVLMMDYRFNPVRWSHWSSFSSIICLASGVDSAASNRRIVMAGATDGFVLRMEQATRSINTSTAISFNVRTPVMTYGSPHLSKTVAHGAVGFQPKNNGNVSVTLTTDEGTDETFIISQDGGSAVLGGVTGFILGTDRLGGARFADEFFAIEDGIGQFRSIQIAAADGVNNQDCEIHVLSLDVNLPGVPNWEN